MEDTRTTDTDLLVRDLLSAALIVQGIELSNVDRVSLLRVNDGEWVLRIADVDGDFESRVVFVERSSEPPTEASRPFNATSGEGQS